VSIGFENEFDLVPNPSESINYLGFGSFYFGRVIESPVIPVQLPWIDGAGLVRIPANGNHGVDVSIEKSIHVLGFVAGYIDTDLCQGGNGLRVNVSSRLRPSRMNFKQVPSRIPQNAFSHVATARITRAENEYAILFHCIQFLSASSAR